MEAVNCQSSSPPAQDPPQGSIPSTSASFPDVPLTSPSHLPPLPSPPPCIPCTPLPFHPLDIPDTSPWSASVRVLRQDDFATPSPLRDILSATLNTSFGFVDAFVSLADLVLHFPFPDQRLAIISTSLPELLATFTFFTRLDLVRLLRSLGTSSGLSLPKERAARRLLDLQASAPPLLFLFKSLDRSRRCRSGGLSVPDYHTSTQSLKRARIDQWSSEYDASPSKRARLSDPPTVADPLATTPPSVTPPIFPIICPPQLKRTIISDFQRHLDPSNWRPVACAVCQEGKYLHEISILSTINLDLSVLHNPGIPEHLLPTEYNLAIYDHALLYPLGMHDLHRRGSINVCAVCSRCLQAKPPRMPEFALANWYYYAWNRLPADAEEAFRNSSEFERMLVAKCQFSRITHRFSENTHLSKFKGDPNTSQSYSRGNTIIQPQDPTGLRNILPPSAVDVTQAMCVLFVGNTEPTPENLARLRPLLCNKRFVTTMIDFLLTRNAFYKGSTSFSQSNLDALFAPEDLHADHAVPKVLEIARVPLDEATRSATSDYTDRYADLETPLDGTDILVEPTGYTDGDHTPQNYREMKAKALKYFRTGHAYLKVRHGSQPLSDRDVSFLTSTFPHLDPWGIGALNDDRRPHKSSFVRQVQHLLRLHNSPFQSDANFAYICMNIITKAEVNKTMAFRVPEAQRLDIVKEIRSFSPEALDAMREKWLKDPYAKPTSRKEKSAFHLLRKLRQVSSHIVGSAGYKTQLRNEIRALMNVLGTPSLFITLNPADVHHPLVRVLGGDEPGTLEFLQRGEPVSKFDRALYVATHPGAAASFFDIMISAFIKLIMRWENGPGLFGTCSGYYGTVEAQGKGTLHLHLLVWLQDSLNPQALRDAMTSIPGYRDRVFRWLEDIISTELPDTTSVVPDDKKKPTLPQGSPHPSAIYPAQIADLDGDSFEVEFKESVSDLAVHCNWHVHSDTCWKGLKGSEPRDDAHCRLRRDGSTRAVTSIDEETGSILLRRLHPRINNYNQLVIFLMRCNMDIKSIGSGQAAKALTFYVTDYITKASLPVHAGLAALSYAIRQNEVKFINNPNATSSQRESSLITKSLNSMMSRQETSHQQVMAFLIGGGDHYTSHEFRVLRWGAFDRYVRAYFARKNECDLENVEVTRRDPEVLLRLSSTVTFHDQVLDYTSRPKQQFFHDISLWEFVASTEKISATGDANIEARLDDDEIRRGPKPLPRGYFSNPDHAQFETHKIRFRRSAYVPVLLGPTIPRREKDAASDEMWCRAMLILFKPWFCPSDLKRSGETWVEAFNAFSIAPHLQVFLQNINVQHECRDARDSYNDLRRSGKTAEPLFSDLAIHLDNEDSEDALEDAVFDDDGLDGASDFSDDDHDDDMPQSHKLDPADTSGVASDVLRLIKLLEASDIRSPSDSVTTDPKTTFVESTVEDDALLKQYRGLLKDLKRDASPKTKTLEDLKHNKPFPLSSVEPRVSVEQLGDSVVEHHHYDIAPPDNPSADPLEEIENIVSECGLAGNPEQERAFRLVAEHFVTGREEQMLMYMGGVGGTGKSHVIRAVVLLFQRCGASEKLLLSAPTGIAAVLIDGYTIHSLTLLPKSGRRPVDIPKLEQIWRDVRWLIIDEVSMISAKFLHEISIHMSLAKGFDPEHSDLPFGGVNVLFSGDFGQLRPVNAKTLFSHDLVEKIKISTAQTIAGQANLHGASLWQNITHHVELSKNWRQENDPMFAHLLNRVRLGQATQRPSNDKTDATMYADSDYKTLLKRTLEQLDNDGTSLAAFADAPFVVARKNVRDPLNLYRAKQLADKTGQDLEFFVALDSMARKPVQNDVQKRLLRLNSSITNDALGKLPMVRGMPFMVTENIALGQGIVNGAEGILEGVTYHTEANGTKVALCAFVNIPGSNMHLDDDLHPDVVPILPTTTSFRYTSADGKSFTISRRQLPLLPAFAYTDYKAQGRGLQKAILDLTGCNSLQSLYVMLSRVQSLDGLAVLRWFRPNTLCQNLQQEFRTEFERLRRLHESTEKEFNKRLPVTLEDVDPQVMRSFEGIRRNRDTGVAEISSEVVEEKSTTDGEDYDAENSE